MCILYTRGDLRNNSIFCVMKYECLRYTEGSANI